jgi:hypothetical protein
VSGLLDLPAPLFDAVFGGWGQSAWGAASTIGILAGASAFASMALYRATSDQGGLAKVAEEIDVLQRRLAGEPDDALDLGRTALQLARLNLRRLRGSLGPALLAGLPFLFVLPWLSNNYDRAPVAAGQAVEVCVEPASAVDKLVWPAGVAVDRAAGCALLGWPDSTTTAITGADGRLLAPWPPAALTPVLHPRVWWNHLVGNPGGYLPSGAGVTALHIAVPARELWTWGPAWCRRWWCLFALVAVVVSLGLRAVWRLH